MKLISPIATKNLLRMLHIYVLHILNTSLMQLAVGDGLLPPNTTAHGQYMVCINSHKLVTNESVTDPSSLALVFDGFLCVLLGRLHVVN